MTRRQISEYGVLIASKVLNIKNVNVKFMDQKMKINPKINAIFMKESYTIYFNDCWLKNSEFLDIMLTSFHETRHAYQYLQIIKSSTLKFIEQEAVLTEWKRGFETYQMPESNKFSLYLKNPIEIDAIAFSTLLVERLFKTTVSVPVSIRQDVIIRRRQIKEVMSLDYFDKD